MVISAQDACLIVLAGGKARRMHGQNKGLIPLSGKAMILHVLDRLTPQLDGIQVIISANEQQAHYRTFGYEVIGDKLAGQLGPLSGIYSAMCHTTRGWVISVPCDVPLIPEDYISRMLSRNTDHPAWVAADTRQHPACCLLSCTLKDEIRQNLDKGQLAVHEFLRQQHAKPVDFSDQSGAFENINTPEQLAELEKHV